MRRFTICTVFVAAVLASGVLRAQQPSAPPAPGANAPAPGAATRGGRGVPPVKSPEIAQDRQVTFRLRAPNAKEVGVVLAEEFRGARHEGVSGEHIATVACSSDSWPFEPASCWPRRGWREEHR